MAEYTPREAERALKEGVESLFAASREAVGEECSAFLTREPPNPYVVYANGVVKEELATPVRCISLDQAVKETLDIIEASYPNSKSQCVVWRRLPEFNEWEECWIQGVKEGDAGWMISVRIAAEPLDG